MHKRFRQSLNIGLKVDIMAALLAAAWSHSLLLFTSCRNWSAVPVLSYQSHVIAVLLREAECNLAVSRICKTHVAMADEEPFLPLPPHVLD